MKQPSAVLDNMKFMARIRRAFEAAHTIPDLVLLLGVEPKVRKSNTAGSNPCKRFRDTAKNIVSTIGLFWEKPSSGSAAIVQL